MYKLTKILEILLLSFSLETLEYYPLRLSTASAEVATTCVSVQPTTNLTLSGTLDDSTSIIDPATIPTVSSAGSTLSTTTFADLEAVAAHRTTNVLVYDSLGATHSLHFFFIPQFEPLRCEMYVEKRAVDPTGSATGRPRLIDDFTLTFAVDGSRNNLPAQSDRVMTIPWNNGANVSTETAVLLSPFTLQTGAPAADSSDGEVKVSFQAVTPTLPEVSETPLILLSPTSTLVRTLLILQT